MTNEFIEQLKSLGYLEAVTAIRRDVPEHETQFKWAESDGHGIPIPYSPNPVGEVPYTHLNRNNEKLEFYTRHLHTGLYDPYVDAEIYKTDLNAVWEEKIENAKNYDNGIGQK